MTIKRNLAANFAGTGWSALLNLAVLPLYLKLLGAELFGLVAFHATLQALFAFLDFGLGAALNRETARFNALHTDVGPLRRLLAAVEVLYWSGAIIIGGVIAVSAGWISTTWLTAVSTSPAAVAHAVRAMGIVLALQFPYALYSAILLGLERHGRLNAVVVVGSTLRLLLPIPVLLHTGPSVSTFFLVQAGVVFAQTIAARNLAQRSLPAPAERVTPDFRAIRHLSGFAVGVTFFMAFSALLMQVDKLVVSRVATLREFATYSIAATAASGLGVIAIPVFASAFPRFSQLLAGDRRVDVEALFHGATQTVSALVVPIAAMMIVYPRELLLLWTRNPAAADAAAIPLSLLAIASCLASLLAPAQALQLAAGWTRWGAGANAVGVVVLGPAMIWAFARWRSRGVAAAAAVWAVGFLISTVIVIHRRLIHGSTSSFLWRDIGAPASAALLVCGMTRWISERTVVHSYSLPLLVAAAALTFVAAVAAVPVTRHWLLTNVFRAGEFRVRPPE